MASVPSLCSADTWVKAELVPAPQLDASPRGRGRGRGRLPPPGSGSHSCSLFSPPKLASPRLPPLLGRDPCYTPSLSPGRQLRAGEVRTTPSSSLEEPPLWLLADPLILPHAPWASLDLPRLLLLSATCSSPVPVSWPRAGVDTALAPGHRGLGAWDCPAGEGRGGGLRQSRLERVPAPRGWFCWLCPQGQLRERGPAGALPGALWNGLRPLTAPRPGAAPGPRAQQPPGARRASSSGPQAGWVCRAVRPSPCQHCGRPGRHRDKLTWAR